MQHYLITNVQYVTLNNLRLNVSAIVLTSDIRACELRLFGCDPALPVTSILIKSLAHLIDPVTPSQYFGSYEPIPIDYDLCVIDRDGTTTIRIPFSTATMDGRPPVIDSYDDGSPITAVWRDLALRVAESHDAPFAPILNHLPIKSVRHFHKLAQENS